MDLNSPINAFLKEFLFFDALRASVKIELPLKSKITKAEFSKFTPACFDGIPLKLTNLKGTTNFDETLLAKFLYSQILM
ncbi:protein of unknown function [Thermococcus camini]|uniref:Uncharacterized protein n=1 Tax=Thermococcus camini TaxID=2016373 RepID=A0A7G2D6F1_9EURY|nr:protein of unknown function [Thermococcus camini]